MKVVNGRLLFSLEAPLEGNAANIRDKFKSRFDNLCSTGGDEVLDVEKERVIVSLEKLVQLCGGICQHQLEGGLCNEKVTFLWKTLREMGILRNNCVQRQETNLTK